MESPTTTLLGMPVGISVAGRVPQVPSWVSLHTAWLQVQGPILSHRR